MPIWRAPSSGYLESEIRALLDDIEARHGGPLYVLCEFRPSETKVCRFMDVSVLDDGLAGRYYVRVTAYDEREHNNVGRAWVVDPSYFRERDLMRELYRVIVVKRNDESPPAQSHWTYRINLRDGIVPPDYARRLLNWPE